MGTATSAVNAKTFRRLRKAYCRLIKKGDKEKITVSTLTEEADISRATFYLHYQNIDEFKEETFKYIISLFIKQIGLFLIAGKEDSVNATKRKNLLFKDDDFELFSCLFSDNKGFRFDREILVFAFNHFNENIEKYFDKRFINKNKSRFDLFYIGYAGVMRENFLDYHSDKVYRDVLRIIEIWEYLFPKYKFKK